MTVLANDGAGNFTESLTFGTDSGERAISAGDMNDDGLLDLVVGALTAQEVQVWTNDGDGFFTLSDSRNAGGEVWMLMLGDVDGNGTEDVAVVNSQTDNGGVLMGDGAGGLGAPRTTATDPFPLATDLADLDGDGDLDWVTSSFFGDWLLFENDGTGSFTLARSFSAPQAASCSLPMDLDNDGVLDLVLIDELEDEIILMASRAVVLASDFESGDLGDWTRAKGSIAVVEPGLAGSGHALEVTADGRRSFVESKRPDRESSLIVSFELDPRQVELAGEAVEILRLGGGSASAAVTLERSGRRYRLRLTARDAGGLRAVGGTRIRADRRTRLEIQWSSASGRGVGDRADGRAALLRNGKVRAETRDLANHAEAIKTLRLGLPRGSSKAASGIFLVDEVLVTR